jgi:serine/threonine protein kinase
MPLSTGQTLNNRYRIVKLLGQGGFGAVYRAWDLNLKIACALKENLDTSPEAQRQFEHEATILAKLHHPNLPRVTDHFIIPGQGQYLVMDFVDGDNLQELLERSGGSLPEDMVLSWLAQICDALTYLHSQKPAIIHRDIKPANIKITSDGRAMLVDFGIAKIFDPHLKTTIGARAITPGYSPPEQYGQGSTDGRTDIYALGATLYTALTGQQPTESVQRTIGTPLTAPRQFNRSISPRIEAIILKAMDTAPTGRFQSALELKNFLAGQGAFPIVTQMQTQPPSVSVRPTATTLPPNEQPHRLPGWMLVGGGGVLLAGLVLVIVIVFLLVNPPGNSHSSQTPLARADTPTSEARLEEPSATINGNTQVQVVIIHTTTSTIIALQPTRTHTPMQTQTNSLIPTGIVITATTIGSANIRSGPGSAYPIIASLVQGVEVTVIGRSADGNWVVVNTTDGRNGWMSVTLLSITGIELLPIWQTPPTPVYTQRPPTREPRDTPTDPQYP